MSVTPPEAVPYACPWPTDPSCREAEWTAVQEPVKTLALAYASATLERLTAYRVGVCPLKLRPAVLRGSTGGCGGYLDPFTPGLGPVNWQGRWYNSWPNRDRKALWLPPPVGRIDEVKVNGSVVDPGDYALQNGNILVWRGAETDTPWPLEQDMSLPDTEVGTMSVTYLNRFPVDAAGANAVTLLALEFAKACANKTCQLPANVTTLVRQGVTMEIAAGSFPGGETGIRSVDAWTAQWNPHRSQRPVMVYSPDMPQHRVEPV